MSEMTEAVDAMAVAMDATMKAMFSGLTESYEQIVSFLIEKGVTPESAATIAAALLATKPSEFAANMKAAAGTI